LSFNSVFFFDVTTGKIGGGIQFRGCKTPKKKSKSDRKTKDEEEALQFYVEENVGTVWRRQCRRWRRILGSPSECDRTLAWNWHGKEQSFWAYLLPRNQE
jgi:hypothetical protein